MAPGAFNAFLNTIQMLAAVSEKLGQQQQRNRDLTVQLEEAKKEITHLHNLLRKSVSGEEITSEIFAKKAPKKKPLPQQSTKGYVEMLIAATQLLPPPNYYGPSTVAAAEGAAKTSTTTSTSTDSATTAASAVSGAATTPVAPSPHIVAITAVAPETAPSTLAAAHSPCQYAIVDGKKAEYEPVSDSEVRRYYYLNCY